MTDHDIIIKGTISKHQNPDYSRMKEIDAITEEEIVKSLLIA